jgi:hypothetical protein
VSEQPKKRTTSSGTAARYLSTFSRSSAATICSAPTTALQIAAQMQGAHEPSISRTRRGRQAVHAVSRPWARVRCLCRACVARGMPAMPPTKGPRGDHRGRGRQWIRGGTSVPDFGLADCFRRLSFPPVLTAHPTMSNRGLHEAARQQGIREVLTATRAHVLCLPHLTHSGSVTVAVTVAPNAPLPAPPETRNLTLADPNNLDSNAP